MRNVIQDLRVEHTSMARLLRILERQTEVFEAGAQPDYGIIQDIVLFFLDFPDQCHHPKEDLLARKLLALSPERAERLGDLIDQHEELGRLTRHLAGRLRRVREETADSPEGLLQAVREFIGAQRHHMEMEEIHFFPLADELLSDANLEDMDAEIFRKEDPLFGPKTEKHFEMLRDNIVKWERTEDQS